MKRQAIPTLLTAVMLALVLAYVSVRNRSDLYIVTNLGDRNTAVSYACDINAAGQIAGYTAPIPDKNGGGFFYSGAGKKALSAPTVHSEAHGLNAVGMVVGCIYNKKDRPHACRYGSDKIEDLGTLGGRRSIAYAVNSTGQTVGYSNTADGRTHAFVCKGSVMQDLGTLGGGLSEAHGINDKDEIVGSAQTAEGCIHAFLYSDGAMQDLGTLGGQHSFAFAVNSTGRTVGYSNTADGPSHAFLYSDGVMQDLGTLPSGTSSFAYGLNAQGEVVGSADTGEGETHAFVYKDGRMKDLNRLIPAHCGWVLSEARAINDKGRIVGFGSFNGKTRAFLLTPQ